MKKTTIVIVMLIISTLLLGACGSPQPMGSPNVNVNVNWGTITKPVVAGGMVSFVCDINDTTADCSTNDRHLYSCMHANLTTTEAGWQVDITFNNINGACYGFPKNVKTSDTTVLYYLRNPLYNAIPNYNYLYLNDKSYIRYYINVTAPSNTALNSVTLRCNTTTVLYNETTSTVDSHGNYWQNYTINVRPPPIPIRVAPKKDVKLVIVSPSESTHIQKETKIGGQP